MEILTYQPIDKLTCYFNKDRRTLIEDLQMSGFLCNAAYCEKFSSCMEPLALVKLNVPDPDIGYSLICKNCKSVTSVLKGSFFQKQKRKFPQFDFRQWFIIFQCWATSIKVKPLAVLLNCKTENILRAYMHLRDLCTWKLINHPELFQFGGGDHIVEVDEKFLPREQKINKPPVLSSNEWIVVIYDLTIKRGAVLFVPGIKISNEVNEILTTHIQPGTTVKIRATSLLNRLAVFGEDSPYNVIKLIDCPNSVTTQKSSSCCVHKYWKRLKSYLEGKGVLISPRLPQHIDEFLWRDIYGRTPKDAYMNLLLQIRERYPC